MEGRNGEVRVYIDGYVRPHLCREHRLCTSIVKVLGVVLCARVRVRTRCDASAHRQDDHVFELEVRSIIAQVDSAGPEDVPRSSQLVNGEARSRKPRVPLQEGHRRRMGE
eukprot:1779378-Pleurochrysis_carterae.AAC.1